MLAGGIFGAPRIAVAQRSAKLVRIGILSPYPPPSRPDSGDPFVKALRDLGYIEGQTIAFEYRYAHGRYDRLPPLAAELVHLGVDVIFTSWGTPSALAAKKATQTIPVVFTGIGDAIGVGLVGSLSRPGGNVTGLTLVSQDTVGKQLQLLKEAVPGMTRVAVVTNPTNPVYGPVLKDVELKGEKLHLRVDRIGVQDGSELEPAFDAARKAGVGGLVFLRDSVFVTNQEQLLGIVSRHRLPAMYGVRDFVDGGGLMSYGPNMSEMYRRAAVYVDRILKGTKPGDLPVEQAERFELVVNKRTARALGVTLPPTLLLRADQVIE